MTIGEMTNSEAARLAITEMELYVVEIHDLLDPRTELGTRIRLRLRAMVNLISLLKEALDGMDEDAAVAAEYDSQRGVT